MLKMLNCWVNSYVDSKTIFSQNKRTNEMIYGHMRDANEVKTQNNFPFVVDKQGKRVYDLTAHLNK